METKKTILQEVAVNTDIFLPLFTDLILPVFCRI
jgi:hypothetical protein